MSDLPATLGSTAKDAPTVPSIDLSLSVVAWPSHLTAPGYGTLLVRFTNQGPDDAQFVRVFSNYVEIPGPASWLRFSDTTPLCHIDFPTALVLPPGGSAGIDATIDFYHPLPAGASAQCEFRIEVLSGTPGSLDLLFRAVSNGPDPDPSDNYQSELHLEFGGPPTAPAAVPTLSPIFSGACAFGMVFLALAALRRRAG